VSRPLWISIVLAAGLACDDPADLPPAPAVVPEAPEPEPEPEPAPEPEPEPVVELPPDPGPDVPAPPELTRGAPKRISARHILVEYDGSLGADPSLRRTRAEAVRRAEDLLAQIRGGADFGKLALKESDGPSAGREGSLGAFGRGTMHADFEKAAFALKVGEVSGLVETPFGLHIIERRPLVEVHLGHVLVQWEGVRRSSSTRTQEEARVIADEARGRLMAGEALADVAAQLSDGGSGPRGGDIGWFQKGHVEPRFEPAFALKRGGVSDVVESSYGYHVLVRIE